MRKYTYTADNEFPDCGRCDYVNASDEFCIRLCGPNRGWNLYQRTEYVEEEDLRRYGDNGTEIHF